MKIFKSALKMAQATVLSRILGLVREQLIAFYFGASGLTDIFYVAYRIPNMLRDLFAEGAFSQAFVPTFMEQKEKDQARHLFHSLMIVLLALTCTCSAVMMIFAPEILSFMAPRFQDDPQVMALAVEMTRIMSFYLCFVSIAALFMGVLNSLKIFFVPALGPALFNIVVILMTYFGVQYFRDTPLLSLAYGVLVGGLVQALFQIPTLVKSQMFLNSQRVLSGFHAQTFKVFKKLGPGLLGLAATQVNLIVSTILATNLGAGAVSWLSYSFRLFQLPIGVLSVSLGNSHLVYFSELFKSGKEKEAFELVESSLSASVFLMLGVSVPIFLEPQTIVSIVFGYGAFGSSDVLMTAYSLKAYALGLVFYSHYKILAPTLYALEKQWVPLVASICSISCNIIFCLLFYQKYGHWLLALGTSLSMLLNGLIQFLFMKWKFHVSWTLYLSPMFFKALFSSAISFTALSQLTITTSHLLTRLIAVSLLHFLIYLLILSLLGEKKLVISFYKKLKTRLK